MLYLLVFTQFRTQDRFALLLELLQSIGPKSAKRFSEESDAQTKR